MIEESSLLNQSEIKEWINNSYKLTSKCGNAHYEITFSEIVGLDKCLMITLYPVDKNIKGDIKNELFSLLRKIINNNYCIIYICDHIDSKHNARNRLFRKWFVEVYDKSIMRIEEQFSEEAIVVALMKDDFEHKELLLKIIAEQRK